MRPDTKTRLSLRTAIVAATILSMAPPAMAQTLDTAKDEPIGQAEFIKNCAVCHGRQGKGDGPLADQLAKRPASLAGIAKRNNGVFPAEYVYQLIDGRQMISAHGTKDMPVWGERFHALSTEEVWPWGSEQIVRGRILELVFYVQSLQER
ncbi:MAG TPA: cytochrome c [Azospirillum sp.]